MDKKIQDCVDAYSELKHLKLVGKKVGIPWQTVYVYLKKAGVNVVGDKSRYGSITDKLAAKAERLFDIAVPKAIDNNKNEFQSTVDFYIGNISVDVKASSLKKYENKRDSPKWGFCINKQRDIADFFVLYAFDENKDKVQNIFLIPREIADGKTAISIPLSLKSKWADYKVSEHEMRDFFDQIIDPEANHD